MWPLTFRTGNKKYISYYIVLFWIFRVHSHAQSIRSQGRTWVVFPVFQTMRVSNEPVCIYLFHSSEAVWHEQLISDFSERVKCRLVLLRLWLARNLENPVMSLYGTEWRERGFRLRALHCLQYKYNFRYFWRDSVATFFPSRFFIMNRFPPRPRLS